MPNKFHLHDVIEIGADPDAAANKGVTDVNESAPILNSIISQKEENVKGKVLDVHYTGPKGCAYTVWNAGHTKKDDNSIKVIVFLFFFNFNL